VQAAPRDRPSRLAIRPYPVELEERWVLAPDLQVLVRPIRPEDESSHQEFFGRLTAEDVSFRFFSRIREMPHSQIARYTQIDYDREMAFVAKDPDQHTLGVVRAVDDPDHTVAEFAIIVRSDLKGRGLGKRLLQKMIGYVRERGTALLVGRVLRHNTRMLHLARSLGFEVEADDGSEGAGDELEVRLWVQATPTN
jgi:acetyltransferase